MERLYGYAEKTTRREKPFPADLSSRREAVLSSVNISLKTATHLIIPPSLITREDLAAKFREMTHGTSFDEMGWATAQSFCFASLVPIGLVAEEVTLPSQTGEKIIGFAKTRAGLIYGDPIAARFLAFEAEHGFSLYPILGKTGVPFETEDRAPGTRSRVLQYLLNGEKLQREIEVDLNLPRANVSATIDALKQAGVVEGQSITTNTGRVKIEYEFNAAFQGAVKKKQNWNIKIVKEVIQIAQMRWREGLAISQDTVYQTLPTHIKNKWQEINLRNSLNGILSGLADQGILIRGKFRGKEKLSIVKLTDKGKLVVEDLLIPLDDVLQDGPTLEQWTNQVLPEVKGKFIEYARKAAETFYPYSQTARNRERAIILDRIVAYVKNSGKVPSYDITKEFGLKRRSVDNYLQRLVANGQLTVMQEKGVNYFT